MLFECNWASRIRYSFVEVATRIVYPVPSFKRRLVPLMFFNFFCTGFEIRCYSNWRNAYFYSRRAFSHSIPENVSLPWFKIFNQRNYTTNTCSQIWIPLTCIVLYCIVLVFIPKNNVSTLFILTMLSKAIHQCINIISKGGYSIGSFPYEWDHRLSRIRITKSKLKILQWWILAGYMYNNTIFMIVRIVQAATILNTHTTQVVMNMFNVVTWICTSAYKANTLLHRDELAEFINQYMKTSEYFESKGKTTWISDAFRL